MLFAALSWEPGAAAGLDSAVGPGSLKVRRNSNGWDAAMRNALFISILSGALAIGTGLAFAGWTFCIGESPSEEDVWISDVFVALHDRARLESAFQAYLRGLGVSHPSVQCPAPKDEKTDALNSQTVAVEFHQRLGNALHEVTPSAFAPKP